MNEVLFKKMVTSRFILICFVSVACFVFEAEAQSGRRKEPTTAPAPTVTTKSPVSASDASDKVTSLVVSGEIFHEDKYNWSNYLDGVLKELTIWMKFEPRPFRNVSKGGKMTFEIAKERAKKETDVHVLWLGIVTVNDNWRYPSVSHIDYSILVPGTAKVLTSGRVYPGKQTIVGQGGVMTIPSVRRRSSDFSQMMQGARQVVDRLKSGGWL